MRKILANYCTLVTLYVSDDATEKEISDALAAEYRNRGFDVYGFDDGDYEEIPMTQIEEMIFNDSTIS